jgi:hypothetical protein
MEWDARCLSTELDPEPRGKWSRQVFCGPWTPGQARSTGWEVSRFLRLKGHHSSFPRRREPQTTEGQSMDTVVAGSDAEVFIDSRLRGNDE